MLTSDEFKAMCKPKRLAESRLYGSQYVCI